eukprot:1876826-Karenia_brevis.AAC.1
MFQQLQGTVAKQVQVASEQEARIQALERSLQQQKSDQQAQNQDINALKTAVTDAVDARDVTDPSFNRPPDATILKLSTNSHKVSKDAMQAVVREWLHGIVGDDQWRIAGPAEGTKWTLQFIALGEAASRLCNQARQALRMPDGSWRGLKVAEHPLFVNLDENAQCSQTGAAARALLKTLKDKYPDIKVEFPPAYRPKYHPKKIPEAILTCDQIDLVTVKINGPFESPSIFWAPGQLERTGINKDETLKDFEAAFTWKGGSAKPDTSMWCK